MTQAANIEVTEQGRGEPRLWIFREEKSVKTRIVAGLMCLIAAVFGQEPLTNDSVMKMVKAGLAEEVVTSMVKTQPAKYTLGPDQLIALKAAGVPDKVVAAMVEKSAGTPTVGVQVGVPLHPTGATPGVGNVAVGDPNDPMTPHDSGIYLMTQGRDGSRSMVMLEQAAYQGSKTGGVFMAGMTYGIKKAKIKAIIPGPRSSIRSSDRNPVFYFYFEDKAAGLGKSGFGASAISNPNQFALVRLEVKKSNRETITGEVGAFGASSGTHEKSMTPFKSERVRAGLYRVVPAGPMEVGEYCFLASTASAGGMSAGAAGAVQMFDFAVGSDQ